MPRDPSFKLRADPGSAASDLRTSGQDGGCGCALGLCHHPLNLAGSTYRQAAAKPPASGSYAQDVKPTNVAKGAALSTRTASSENPKKVRCGRRGHFRADSLIARRAHPVKP
jgi:hypothetical protein